MLSQFPSNNNVGHSPKGSVKGFGEFGGGESNYEGSGPKHKDESKSTARFFYCAKVSKKERNFGDTTNTHPTVKPVALMAYLCKLITPVGGTILDPFNGSGSTGMAAIQEGFSYVGIDLDEEHIKVSDARIRAWNK